MIKCSVNNHFRRLKLTWPIITAIGSSWLKEAYYNKTSYQRKNTLAIIQLMNSENEVQWILLYNYFIFIVILFAIFYARVKNEDFGQF